MDESGKPDSNQALSAGQEKTEQHIHLVDEEETNTQTKPIITTSPEPELHECDDDIADHSEATSATFSGAGENIESRIGDGPLLLCAVVSDHEEQANVSGFTTAEPVDADDDW